MFEEFTKEFQDSKYLKIDDFERFNKTDILFIETERVDRIVGFCAIEDFPQPEKKTVGRYVVAVLPEFRNRGIARSLSVQAISNAFYWGKEKIWLSVYSDNLPAIHLYETLGFRVEGVFRNEEYDELLGYRDVYSMALFKKDWIKDTKKIEWGSPDIGSKEVDNLLKCVHNDWYTSGPQVKEFSERVSEYTGAKYNFPVNNGTSALLAAYAAVDMQDIDTVVFVPNYTFPATYNAARIFGNNPIVCDVDQYTGMIDLDQVESKINRHTKHDLYKYVIVSVAVGGICSNYHRLNYLKDRYGVIVIEDGAAALGGKGWGFKVGEGADITTFSLHASKVITAIEGGIVSTNNDGYAQYIEKFISHGENKLIKYKTDQMGLNLRPSDLHFSIGLAQLDKLDRYIEHRKELLQEYKLTLGDDNFQKIPYYVESYPAWCCLYFAPDKNGLISYLKSHNIDVRPSWNGLFRNQFLNSDWIEDHGIFLPLHNKLDLIDVNYIVKLVREYEQRI